MGPPAGDIAYRAAPRRRALAALCATEIVSYGVLYYAFPVLAGDISASTGWPRTAVTAAFSAGNLTGVFYPPAFAALTGWYGPGRVRALTTLTLAAGFARSPGGSATGRWPLTPAYAAGRWPSRRPVAAPPCCSRC